MHVKKVIDSGRTRLNQLHAVNSNRSTNLSARRMLLLAVLRPSPEYRNEIWEYVTRGRQMHWSLFYWGVLERFGVVLLEHVMKLLERTWV